MVTLTNDDRRAIANAVTKAEAATSGEICCLLTEEASHYREIPLAWAVFAALVLPAIALGFDLRPEKLARIVPQWTAVEMPALHRHVLVALMCYAIMQVLVFAAVALVVAIPRARRALTPAFIRRHRVRRSARNHFVTLNARLSTPAFVLIYASRFDRMVEVVVSEAVHKVCDAAVWKHAADATGANLARGDNGEGFVSAIEICGAELARHFPPDGNIRAQDSLIEE
jgi:putative membrane protein